MAIKSSSLSLRLRNVIICDDIRVEISGKCIFIGVYTDQIVVSDFPANLNLAFWCDLDTPGEGEQTFEIKVVLGPDSAGEFSMGARIGSESGAERANLSFGGVNFHVEKEGYIAVLFRAGEGPWVEADRKAILDGRKLLPQPSVAAPPAARP